ncbi:hypothetical protein AgCh_024813 [Apium graveolens]
MGYYKKSEKEVGETEVGGRRKKLEVGEIEIERENQKLSSKKLAAKSNRFPRMNASRSHARSRCGASHDGAAAQAISAVASVIPLPSHRPV